MAPGRYRIDIVAFLSDDYGKEQYLDGVYPGLLIEIKDFINDENYLLWQDRFWGHVRFADAEISTETIHADTL